MGHPSRGVGALALVDTLKRSQIVRDKTVSKRGTRFHHGERCHRRPRPFIAISQSRGCQLLRLAKLAWTFNNSRERIQDRRNVRSPLTELSKT